jgi:hypothetical protein
VVFIDFDCLVGRLDEEAKVIRARLLLMESFDSFPRVVEICSETVRAGFKRRELLLCVLVMFLRKKGME